MARQVSPQEILQDAAEDQPERHFRDDRELQEAVVRSFNKHIRDVPPGYSYLDLIALGVERGWIHKNQTGIVLNVTHMRAEDTPHPPVSDDLAAVL